MREQLEQVALAKKLDDWREPWSVCTSPDLSPAGYRYHPGHDVPLYRLRPLEKEDET